MELSKRAGERGGGATASLRVRVRWWTAFYAARVQWSAGSVEPVEAPAPPSEARVLDALEARAVDVLRERGGGARAVAAMMAQLDAVARVRRETGARAAPVESGASMAKEIARRIHAEVCAAIDAAPAPAWAEELAAELAARADEASAAAAGWLGPPRGRRAEEVARRMMQALREAEVGAIAALLLRSARGADVREELEQLAAIVQALDAIGFTRAQLYELGARRW